MRPTGAPQWRSENVHAGVSMSLPADTARSSQARVMTADEAVLLIKSGDRVYLHEVAMTPH